MRRGLILSITLAAIATAVMVAAGFAMAAQISGAKAEEAAGSSRPETEAPATECAGEGEAGETGEVGEAAPGTEGASCPAGEAEAAEAAEVGGAAEGEATAGAPAVSGAEAAGPQPEASPPATPETSAPAKAGGSPSGEGEAVRGSEIIATEATAPEDESGSKAGSHKRRRKGSSTSDGSAKGGEEASDGGTSAAGSAAASGTESGSLSSLSIGTGESTLDSLDVPVALLPVYQACGSSYGISWEVLAAINKVETNFGTNLGPSSAGAEGWMQFLPSTWKQWGIDADGDGKADPNDPVDAICSAARYLAASGGESDIYDAVLAYNHADWYANEVLADAREYERAPANLVNSLTELAAGSTSPVAGKVSYWNQAKAEEALSGGWTGEETIASEGGGSEKGAKIGAEVGAEVRAVVTGTVTKVRRDGLVVLDDAYGDRFVYSSLGATEVEVGAEVAAGDVIGRVGSRSVGFAVHPDGSSELDPTELLEVWEQGGAGGIYSVDTEAAAGGVADATRSLLMSADALSREVLADTALTLPRCVRQAVAAGDVQRQSLASLEYLTARGYELGVAASTCQRRSGFVVEVETVDGKSVGGSGGQGAAPRSLVRAALAMDGAAAPQRVVSATGVAGSTAGQGEGKTIELDYRPPEQARLVDGEAIAPTNAPAAVQAMIAAANQIDDQPYVWGGGHGAWVSAGYDCSGAVSYVLHAAKMLSSPQTSGALASWGESGTGSWVTVYANAEHTYAVIAGLRWDTVGDASGTGPRWHTGAAYPAGFAVRHPSGY